MLGGEVGCFRCSSLERRNADSNLPPLGRRCSPGFRFRLRLRFFWHGGPRSKWIEYICPKTCMAMTGPAMTRRKDRYQPRAASASQPKTLKTYACARDCNSATSRVIAPNSTGRGKLLGRSRSIGSKVAFIDIFGLTHQSPSCDRRPHNRYDRRWLIHRRKLFATLLCSKRSPVTKIQSDV